MRRGFATNHISVRNESASPARSIASARALVFSLCLLLVGSSLADPHRPITAYESGASSGDKGRFWRAICRHAARALFTVYLCAVQTPVVDVFFPHGFPFSHFTSVGACEHPLVKPVLKSACGWMAPVGKARLSKCDVRSKSCLASGDIGATN